MSFIDTYLFSLLVISLSLLMVQRWIKPVMTESTFVKSLFSFLLVFFFLVSIDTVLLLITRKPFFSSGITIVFLVVVTAVNHAKYTALREPLVFTDFYLYFQAFRHPRLYLPFLGAKLIVGIVVSVLLILFLGSTVESSHFTLFSEIPVYLVVIVGILLYVVVWSSRMMPVSANIMSDAKSYGVLASLLLYFSQSIQRRKNLQRILLDTSPFSKSLGTDAHPEQLGDLVVIQSESFFDARTMHPSIKSEILSEYDQLCSESNVFGTLKVPAWGANTMRTEFSFLTGVTPDVLGFAQYYPYQQLLKYDVPSLLSHLKSIGYHCICIHPNAANFFMRDVFFKRLGFDEFIDDKSFQAAKCVGPYIADSEITKMIKQISERKTDKPLFIFAITMENHGPLHLEDVADDEWKAYFSEYPGQNLDDLIVYLRHLKNADKMIADLKAYFISRNRQTVFGFYGDHVPAMSDIFESLNYKDSRSNFLIWSTERKTQHERDQINELTELASEELASMLVRILHTI